MDAVQKSRASAVAAGALFHFTELTPDDARKDADAGYPSGRYSIVASKVAFITNSGGRFGLGHPSRCDQPPNNSLANGHEVQIFLGKNQGPQSMEKSRR